MTADTHEVAVARLREAYAALPPGTPVRLAKRTSNLFRFRDADPKTPRTQAAQLDVSAFGHVLRVDPARRTAWVGGMTTYEDLADATLAARAHAEGGAAAQDHHPGRRGHRAGHRVHLAAQRPAARVGHRDGDPDRRRPRAACHRRQRARRPVPRIPELLRHPRLRPVAHHRARAGAAVRAPAPLPVRQRRKPAWTPSARSPPRAASAATGPISSTAPRSRPTSCTSPSGRSATSRRGAATTPASRSTTSRSRRDKEDFLTIRDYLWRWDTDWFWCSRAFGVQKPLIRQDVAAPVPALGRVPQARRPRPSATASPTR